MARTALTLVFAAGLSAWAAAQTPPSAPSGSQRREMLLANRSLLDALFRTAVEVSDSDNELKRIEACQTAAKTLSEALGQACRDRKSDRAAELGDYLSELLTEGLLPAVDQARPHYQPGSPGHTQFLELNDKTATVVQAAAGLIPAESELGRAPKVQAARGKLADAARQLANK